MHFNELSEEKQQLLGALFDPESPLSLASSLPGTFASRLLRMVDQAEGEFLNNMNDETALLAAFKSLKSYVPTVNDQRLRYLFWTEYEKSKLEGRVMDMKNVHSLVCNPKTFESLFLKLPYRAVFLCCKPMAYEHTLKEMLLHGMQRMRQVLDIPATDPITGKLNPKIIELQLKITAMVDMRVHGAPTQKIHQVTQSIQGKPTQGQVANLQELIAKGDMSTIQTRLKEIEAEKKKLEGRVTTQPVEIVEAELVPVKNK